MKLSFVISTQPTQFQAVSFSPDLEANAARVSQLGYDGIELAVRDPAMLDVTNVRRVLDKYHLAVPALGTGQAWGEEHLSFTDSDQSMRERAVKRIKSHIPLAKDLNALVIIGLIRGVAKAPVTHEQARSWIIDAMQEIAQEGDRHQVRFAIEPINRYETNLLNNVAETNALIGEIGMGNVGILYDTFHSNIEEPHLDESLRACKERLYHVHLADSNRWAPGVAHLDFREITRTLNLMNYRGWVSAEILPKPDIATAQEWTIKAMRPLL